MKTKTAKAIKTSEFNSIETVALAKLVSKGTLEKSRAQIDAGTHKFSFILAVNGEMTVGEDYGRTPTVAIPLIETIALFLSRAGATREATEKLLVECMTEALLESEKGQGALIPEINNVATMMERVEENVLSQLPKAECKGPVKVKLAMKRINIEHKELSVEKEAEVASV